MLAKAPKSSQANGKNREHKILIVHECENYDLISSVCGAPLPLLQGFQNYIFISWVFYYINDVRHIDLIQCSIRALHCFLQQTSWSYNS